MAFLPSFKRLGPRIDDATCECVCERESVRGEKRVCGGRTSSSSSSRVKEEEGGPIQFLQQGSDARTCGERSKQGRNIKKPVSAPSLTSTIHIYPSVIPQTHFAFGSTRLQKSGAKGPKFLAGNAFLSLSLADGTSRRIFLGKQQQHRPPSSQHWRGREAFWGSLSAEAITQAVLYWREREGPKAAPPSPSSKVAHF